MDLMGMMGKLQETQAKVEEAKKRMDSVTLQEQSNDELLKLTLTANSEIKNVVIAEELLEDKEQLEDYLVLTLNKALKKAKAMHEEELAKVARSGMPNIPGFGL